MRDEKSKQKWEQFWKMYDYIVDVLGYDAVFDMSAWLVSEFFKQLEVRS